MKTTNDPILHRWQRAVRRTLLPLLLGLTAVAAEAAPTEDRLTLLIPDDAVPSSWQVKVWTDSAAEEGIRLELITDSAFLALGNTAASRIAGLVVPDSAHIRASNAVVAAITQYAYTGGNLMLVYDAGVQTETGFFPTATNSRFAPLVGVDYVFWNGGLGAATMVGFGPVVGTRGRFDMLSLPPGKYVPYAAPASTTTSSPSATTAFVGTSTADPSGSTGMAAMMRARAANPRLASLPMSLSEVFGPLAQVPVPLRFDRRNLLASWTMGSLTTGSNGADFRAAKLSSSTASYTELAATTGPSTDPSPYAISGYLYGPLGYYHYVTSGAFPGTVWLSSPEHGLVAGTRTYGSGRVLFVNIPLGYFKAIGTDAAPLHGFLSAFARDEVGIATLSTQPKGRGGLIYNWHIDNNNQINDDARNLLNTTRIFNRGPYSIHFTGGPDVDFVGDRIGVNLNNDSSSRDILRRMGNLGLYGSILNILNKLPDHEIGAHGGWIHNYWAENASETNAATFTNYLQLNYDAVNAVTGDKLREYSSPGGNTPTWALTWLEARGVVAAYLVGDVGSGMVRSWRNGTRLTNKLWSSPVTPQGPWATWEEFDENGIPDSASGQWLLDLQSFVMNHRTNRLFYNHAPGARAHQNPINALLTRSDRLQDANLFQWYTMSQLADFSQRRVETTWTTTTSAGRVVFNASNAKTLTDMTWLLPKSGFSNPAVTSGWGNVTSDSKYWIVTAVSGTSLTFSAQPQ